MSPTIATSVTVQGTTYTAEAMTITSTFLGVQRDSGVLTFELHCKGFRSAISVGGVALESVSPDTQSPVPTDAMGRYVSQILDVLEVDSWEHLPGALALVLFQGCSSWGVRASGIAHPVSGKAVLL
ncbi:Uncharacterised protein [Mycobacteroides abscessus subsp. abscessus]|uniref:hypothetical protein n=1 Tax=Mycobacteroides abscessus TaxID=36809 RepID=UPI000925EEB2|nr:hypothetical protein [Mycobacteroides abscessus]SIM05530.1 Uncharacterised protein [Mycobacteroides abscessus subsp. abscessus]SLC77443.1 Uncharacterised protein [Mycobacteroides abscessus subsp. abscessus]